MKYLGLFLEKNGDMPTGGAYETYETPDLAPRELRDTPADLPTKPTEPPAPRSGRGYPTAELGAWPIERRERWGRLANQLEDEGVPFPESERRAFDQVKAEKEAIP